MTKYELSNHVAQQLGIDQAVAKQVVQMTLDGIIDVLVAEGQFELRGFGVFKVRTVRARKARNPRTGVEVMVPERRRVGFKVGKDVKKRVESTATP